MVRGRPARRKTVLDVGKAAAANGGLRLGIAAGTAAATGAVALLERKRHGLEVGRLRATAAKMTYPLLPDDYLTLINPLWSARELRGKIVSVEPEGPDAATLHIKPGWGWPFGHEAGQYLGIGVDVGGRWHWRSYSITSVPTRGKGLLSITVRATPEGFLSGHLVGGLEPGTVVRLASPKGDFVLPSPPPPHALFMAGGSGITPVMSMLRTLDRRGTMPDIDVVVSATSPERALFRDELRALDEKYDTLRLIERFTDTEGVLRASSIGDVVPDWKQRPAWACGPAPMLQDLEDAYKAAGVSDKLHIERFGTARKGGGEGGKVTFRLSGKTIETDGATSLLEAGEKAGVLMPFGCRMGICHTCVLPLIDGTVQDMRDGSELRTERVQTCIVAASGDCILDI